MGIYNLRGLAVVTKHRNDVNGNGFVACSSLWGKTRFKPECSIRSNGDEAAFLAALNHWEKQGKDIGEAELVQWAATEDGYVFIFQQES